MSKAAYIITDIWLKELVLNNNPDLNNFHKEELVKMIKFCREEITRYKEVIDKVSNDIQILIEDVNNKTIISIGEFIIKLETIQDELNRFN